MDSAYPACPFPLRDGALWLGGQPLRALLEQAGGTPAYLYDAASIAARVAAVRAALPEDVQLHYAIKANPMPALLEWLAPRVDGFDVASAGELALALDAGMAPDRIGFAGPGKREVELRAALQAGVLLSVESPGELRRLAALAAACGCRPRVLLRVNPDFELKSAGMRMGGGPKPFGIDAEQVPAVLRELATLDLDWWGLQVFAGSQNLQAAALYEAQRNILDLAIRLQEAAPGPMRVLNMGGGWGVPYFAHEQPLSLPEISANLHVALDEARPALPGVRYVLELGRYLVAEAGIYVCQVVDRKLSRGQVFLVTDGGMHHHLAASGNFGQVLRKNYPLALATRMDAAATEVVTVVGPLCTPLDVLGERVALPPAVEGDLVAVFQSGAYGYSASPLGFLGHPPPAQLLVMPAAPVPGMGCQREAS